MCQLGEVDICRYRLKAERRIMRGRLGGRRKEEEEGGGGMIETG